MEGFNVLKKSKITENLNTISKLTEKEHSGRVQGYSISACQQRVGEVLRVVSNTFRVGFLEADYFVKEDNKYVYVDVHYKLLK